MAVEIPVSLEELSQFGTPIRLHHLQDIIHTNYETLIRNDLLSLEEVEFRAKSRVDEIGRTPRLELFGEDRHTYQIDVLGNTDKSAFRVKGDLLNVYINYYGLRPEDNIIISGFPDMICNACAIGDHCKVFLGTVRECHTILKTADWFRLAERLMGRIDDKSDGFGFFSTIKAIQGMKDCVNFINFQGAWFFNLPRFGMATTMQSAAQLWYLGPLMGSDNPFAEGLAGYWDVGKHKDKWQTLLLEGEEFEPMVSYTHGTTTISSCGFNAGVIRQFFSDYQSDKMDAQYGQNL